MPNETEFLPALSRGEVRGVDVVQCRNLIYDKLVRSGKIYTVKSHLSDILRFSGWSAMIRERCTQYIKREGIENVNFSHMLCDMIPYARNEVPSDIRESMNQILRSIALAHLTLEDLKSVESEEGAETTSETYLPYEYQARDKVPDYGDPSVFNQLPDINIPSPAELHSPAPISPAVTMTDRTSTVTTNSPNNIAREMGGIVLLDRVDPDKENEKIEKEKADNPKEKESKDKERHDRERSRHELEKERAEKMERDRHERRDRETVERDRTEQKDRDRPDPPRERRERHSHPQSLSVPSSPSTPRQEKKGAITEAAVMMKLGQTKPAPPLASTLITATAAITGKKSKHINLNIDDDDDDEELMDI